MIPTTWLTVNRADQIAWLKPTTYVKWIIDKAIEWGYLSVGSSVWGGITGDILNQTDLITLLGTKQDTISLTTAGTSGPATLVGTTLNIPDYDSGISPLYGSYKISGSVTWSGTGLIFDWTIHYFVLNGVVYTSAASTHTSAPADLVFTRLDVFYVDIFGGSGIIEGVPDSNPVKPEVDPATQLEVGFVLIGVGATTPNISNIIFYDEGTESTNTSDIAGINFMFPTNPFSGTKSTYVPSFTTKKYIKYQHASVLNTTNYGNIKFYLRLPVALSNSAYLGIKTQNGLTTTSQTLPITNGTFGFDRTIINIWQTIVIPISSLLLTSNLFDSLSIMTIGTGPSGFQVDLVHIQTGSGGSSPNGVQTFNTRSGHVLSLEGDYKQPYTNFASFPATGDSAKIYIARDTGLTYEWNGTVYNQIGGGSETDPTVPALVKAIPVSADAAINKYLHWDGSAYIRKQIDISEISGSVTVSDADATTKGILKLTNELGGTADLPEIANAAVIAKLLTAFASAPGGITSADSLLSAIQKLDGNIGQLQVQIGAVQVGNNLFNYYNFK